MALLVLVIGPIASGKSTVSAALGRAVRESGRTVAVTDVDDVVDTIGGFRGLTAAMWHAAQVVHGELVGSWLRAGVDVIAHGPFFDADEDDVVRHAAPPGTDLRRVQLLATYDVALERVRDDPHRDISKDPIALRSAYDRFDDVRPGLPAADWTFDSATTSVEEIVRTLSAALR